MARDFTIYNDESKAVDIVYKTYAISFRTDDSALLATLPNISSSAYLATLPMIETKHVPFSQQINGPISLKNTHVAYQLAVGDKE
jgi:hypothetical protein